MFDVNILADNIKKHRLKIGLDQNELAESLYISARVVSEWEQAVSVPDIRNLCALAELFGVSVNELLANKYTRETVMIGVDGGGTKTEFVLFTESGNIKRRIVLDGSNPNIYGIENTFKVLKTGIDSLYSLNTEIAGIYCGIAGTLSGNNHELINEFLHSTYTNAVVECNSDIFNVAASVTELEKCITVICGTGSNISAINGNKLNRIGGWGYLFDGKGSGFDIGRDAVAAVLAQDDGIGNKTLLTELLTERLGASVWDSINNIYAQDISYIASFTEEVFKAYRLGDKIAGDIIESNMNALTDKINFAARKYDCGDTVVLSGGVINHDNIPLDFVKKNLDKRLRIVVPTLPQIFGACKLCCKYCNVNNEKFNENFTLDYEQLIGGNL